MWATRCRNAYIRYVFKYKLHFLNPHSRKPESAAAQGAKRFSVVPQDYVLVYSVYLRSLQNQQVIGIRKSAKHEGREKLGNEELIMAWSEREK